MTMVWIIDCSYSSIKFSYFSTCYPELITDQDDVFTSVIFPSTDDGQMEATERQTERQTDVMSVCTFLPQLAETPVEQSQDKANEYGLDRLQYGWLEGREGGGAGGGGGGEG